jgi:diguanylate cyclase (GGDEF)-like protein
MNGVEFSGEFGSPGWWSRVWRDPDPAMLDAGTTGERVIAWVRIVAILILLTVPVGNVMVHPELSENWIGVAVTAIALLLAIVVFYAVRRDQRPRWLGAACTIFDVTIISAALLTYVLTDQPLVATNSRVAFECYFLAFAATCLRYDARLCILAGGLAIAEYLGLVFLARSMYDLSTLSAGIQRYGGFDWGSIWSRVIVLGIATFFSTVIVMRAKDLRKLSSLDRMTGLFNRGHFDERLGAELNRAQRMQQPLSVVMLDVDRFKEFNDRFGHSAGDVGLRTISDRFRQMTRRSDVVARYGGEEFVFLLPDTSADTAFDKLEQIRASVEGLRITLPKGQGEASLTVSAGIATFPADGTNAEELIDEADARLFRAKAGGRNRVAGRLTLGTTRPPQPSGLEMTG